MPVWKEEHSVGHPELDRQHRVLHVLCDEIENLSECEELYLPKIHLLIFNLRDYIAVHFSTEEEMLRLVDYPDLKKHIAQHRIIVEKLNEIERSALKGDANLESIKKFLNGWLHAHNMHADIKFKPYFKCSSSDLI